MTVSTADNKISYVGNGIAVEFAIPFPFWETSHLKVRQLLNDIQTQREDWTVSNGNLVFETAPEDGAQIVVIREVPFTQETDYRENEILSAETLERNLDKLTMQIQQVKEQTDRAVTVDLFSASTPSEIIGKIETLYQIKDKVVTAAELSREIKNCSDNMSSVIDAPDQALSAALSAGEAALKAGEALSSAERAAASESAAAESAERADLSAVSAETCAKSVAGAIQAITATNGSVPLLANQNYKMTVSGATTFVLPATVNASVHNQIKLFLNLAAVVSVNWGTTLFFNETAPEIDAVGKYCVYWDYDPNAGKWVCGGMKEGVAA